MLQANRGTFCEGSDGPGGTQHLAAEMFRLITKTDSGPEKFAAQIREEPKTCGELQRKRDLMVA